MDKLNLNIIIYPFVALASIYGIALNKEKIVYKYLAFILTFLSMIRFDTGYDYYWYYAVSKYQYMYHPRIQRLYVDLEPGIQKIVDIARYYKHPQYFFAITGLITFGFIYYTIYRDSKSSLVSLGFFMFLQMGFLNGNAVVMQACALAICFFSYRYCYEKRYTKYIILIIIATYFFHNSAIICLFFIFIPREEMTLKLWIAYILGLVVFFKLIIIKVVQTLFPQYLYVLVYENSKLYGKKDITICFVLLVVIFIFKYIKIFFRKVKVNRYIVFLENIYIAGTLFSIITLFLIGGFFPFRVGIYAMINIFIIIGYYFYKLKKNLQIKLKVSFVVILMIYQVMIIIKSDDIYLDKIIHYNEDGTLNKRPNSYGFKIFLNKTERDMYRYLPNQKRGSWK